MEEIKKIPPVTRTLLFATAAVTLPALLKLANPYLYLLWWPAVLKKGQVWRLFTAFFLGGGDIQLLFDLFMLLRNSTDLEVNTYYRKTSDYTWALLLINTLILATNYPLQSTVLFSPFMMAIVYLWSRANPAASVSIFGLVNCPAPYLPYTYLFLDLLRGGMPLAVQSSTGIVSAYLYCFFKDVLPASNGGRGLRLVPGTPMWLKRLLPDSPDPATQGQTPQPGGSVRSTGWGGTAFAPAGRNWGETQPPATASTSGQRLNSGGGGIRSWLPFGGSNESTASGARSGSARRSEGPDREAMLAAAEARLKALRENSIAGRNEAASALARQAANSREAQARQRKAGTSASAGSVLSAGTESKSSSIHRGETSTPTRRAAAGGFSSRAFTFGQNVASKDDREGNDDDKEQETASSSGGTVAELRRPNDTAAGGQGRSDKAPDHSWGTGHKLGE